MTLDESFDFIFDGDGLTFPVLNWSVFGGSNGNDGGFDFCGDGSENNLHPYIVLDLDNIKIFYDLRSL